MNKTRIPTRVLESKFRKKHMYGVIPPTPHTYTKRNDNSDELVDIMRGGHNKRESEKKRL
jgi:hypothetical protein